MTPSNMSGALPITTASTSAQPRPASASATSAASRTRPAIETSIRFDACLVWPTPITAQRSAIAALSGWTVGGSLEDAHQVLLQARTRRRVGHRPAGTAIHHSPGRLADADQPRHHHRVARQGAAGRVDRRVAVELQRIAQDQLLVA